MTLGICYIVCALPGVHDIVWAVPGVQDTGCL